MNLPVGVLIDTTRCKGCEKCVVACKEENGLGEDRPARGDGTLGGLSATRLGTILRRPDNRFVRQQCRHCLEPACASACPVGALRKTPEGPVIYDENRCMGCRYCMLACPYGIPRYEWDSWAPRMRKCSLCYPRVKEGRPPACVEACPEGALAFGGREEMLAEARRRLAEDPSRYVQKIYGEHEVGGASVLYISDIPLDFLAWRPDLSDQPLPALSWAALEKVPLVVLGVGGLVGAVYWIIGRRIRLARLAAEKTPSAPEDGPSPEGTDGAREADP